MSYNFDDFPDEILTNITSNLRPKDEATVNILSKRFAHLKPTNYAYLFKDARSYQDYENVIFNYYNVPDVLEYFLKSKISNQYNYINRLFVNACVFGYIQIVDRLLKDPRVNPSYENNRAIQEASHNGHIDVVETLLNDGRVNPADDENLAIIYASKRGYTDIVDRLLDDPRVDPSDQDNRAIIDAVRYNQIDVVKRLLKDPRVDATAQYGQAIYNAIRDDNLEMLELLSLYIGDYIAENKNKILNIYVNPDPDDEVYQFIKNFE